jgi:hypothetical protein
MAKRTTRKRATPPPQPPVRIIVGLSANHTVDADSLHTDDSVTLQIHNQSIILTSQHVTSDDGTQWYFASIPSADLDRILPSLRAHSGVVSAYVQPPDGPP